MAYVPPALRKRAQGSAPPDGTLDTTAEAAGSHDNLPPDFAPGPTFPLSEIHNHYWNTQNEGNGPFISTQSTLNSSAQDPDKLKYILVFRDANPRWQSHGIIFVKSKLYILPGGERFRDDPLGMGGATRVDPSSSSNKHGLRDSSHDGETFAEGAGVPTNRCPSQKSLKEDQASEKSRVSQEQNFGVNRQENDEKGVPSGGVEKKRGASAKSDEPPAHSTNDQAHDPRTKDNRKPEPPYSPDLSLYDTGPIAVFEQAAGPARNGAATPFNFAGYHRIASLEYLAPHSRELFQLLEQKFTLTDRRGRVRQKQRSEVSWRVSLKHRWAVIQMEKDQEANDRLPPPKIEVRDGSVGGDDTSSPRKSVNELLREMRLKD